jgi:hypothetical protein
VFLHVIHPIRGDVIPQFEAAAPFDATTAHLHINEQEMIAVLKGIGALIFSLGELAVRGRRFDFWLDNEVAVVNFTKGGGRSPALSERAKELFELQRRFQFSCSFKWWGTRENVRADALSRGDVRDDIRLAPDLYERMCDALLRQTQATCVVDTMADPGGAQWLFQGSCRLPFVSRYPTGEELAVDLLAQNWTSLMQRVLVGTQSHSRPVGYCFPPPEMRLPVIAYLAGARAAVVLVLPRRHDVWWPTMIRSCVWMFTLWAHTEGGGGQQEHCPRPDFPFLLPSGEAAPGSQWDGKTDWCAFLCNF